MIKFSGSGDKCCRVARYIIWGMADVPGVEPFMNMYLNRKYGNTVKTQEA